MNLMKACAATAAIALGLVLAAPATAQEKKDIVLGVGGKGLLYYLPLTLAERLGQFKE
jgi:NitT/TauT family transport system substrate-binding protein